MVSPMSTQGIPCLTALSLLSRLQENIAHGSVCTALWRRASGRASARAHAKVVYTKVISLLRLRRLRKLEAHEEVDDEEEMTLRQKR